MLPEVLLLPEVLSAFLVCLVFLALLPAVPAVPALSREGATGSFADFFETGSLVPAAVPLFPPDPRPPSSSSDDAWASALSGASVASGSPVAASPSGFCAESYPSAAAASSEVSASRSSGSDGVATGLAFARPDGFLLLLAIRRCSLNQTRDATPVAPARCHGPWPRVIGMGEGREARG